MDRISSPPRERSGGSSLLGGALTVLGIGLLAGVVYNVGVTAIAELLVRARFAFLLGLVLEGARIACEGFGSAMLFQPAERKRGVVRRVLEVELRTYALCQMAPMGRTAAEALKVPLLAEHGSLRSRIGVAVRGQALGLFSIAAVSVPCILASGFDGSRAVSARTLAIGAHAGIALVAALLLVGTRAHEKMARFVAQRWPHLAGGGRDITKKGESRRVFVAAPFVVAARLAQIAQVAIFASALGSAVDLQFVLVAVGVHYAGAGAGDVVPGHVGASEAAMA